MGRLTYVCATCSEHFTRKYSATRHNLTIHNGKGEIVRFLEYLLGRSSGRYLASHPSWYKRKERSVQGSATVADTIGNTFEPRDGPQQAPLGVSQYSTSPMYRPTHTANDQRYGTGLSQQTILKIEELKRLVNKYPRYHTNPDEIVKSAIHRCINGDNKFLNEKLEQLRGIDSLANIKF